MRIMYDTDTQNDFMNANGALYVPGAEMLKGNLALLGKYAREQEIPIVASVDRHFGIDPVLEAELQRFGGPFPDHCMDNTYGQLKIQETMLLDPLQVKNKTEISVAEVLQAREALLERKPVVIQKQTYDVFDNPAASKILMPVREAIVYGVATDYCVRAAVLGMQGLGIQTYVVEDAIKGISPKTEAQALEEMAQAGAKLVTTQDVLEGRL